MIHGSSFHPHVHKRAGILPLIHCLISLPLSHAEFVKELQTIQYLAYINSVSIEIRKIVRRKTYRKHIQDHSPLSLQINRPSSG